MTETTTPTNQAPAPQTGLIIQRVFIKDTSFEAPNTPEIFLDEWKPQVDIEIQNRARALGNDLHEVVLRVAVTAKINAKTAFLIEVQQAGVFSIHGLPEDQISAIVGGYCPTILFPYAREAVASMIMRGGFPPIHLAPVNFEAAYQQHLQQLANKAAETGEVQH